MEKKSQLQASKAEASRMGLEAKQNKTQFRGEETYTANNMKRH